MSGTRSANAKKPRVLIEAGTSLLRLRGHPWVRGTSVSTARATPVDRPSYLWCTHSAFEKITDLAKAPIPYPPLFSPNIQGDVVVQKLSERVNRSLEICKNRGLPETDGLWRTRTRACVETTALLVCCANAKFVWFGDI